VWLAEFQFHRWSKSIIIILILGLIQGIPAENVSTLEALKIYDCIHKTQYYPWNDNSGKVLNIDSEGYLAEFQGYKFKLDSIYSNTIKVDVQFPDGTIIPVTVFKYMYIDDGAEVEGSDFHIRYIDSWTDTIEHAQIFVWNYTKYGSSRLFFYSPENIEYDEYGCPTSFNLPLTNTVNLDAYNIEATIVPRYKGICPQRLTKSYDNLEAFAYYLGPEIEIDVCRDEDLSFKVEVIGHFEDGDYCTYYEFRIPNSCNPPCKNYRPDFSFDKHAETWAEDDRPSSVTVYLTNTGTRDATDVTLTLIPQTANITVKDPKLNYNSILIGESFQGRFELEADTWESPLKFKLHLAWNDCYGYSGSKDFYFNITLIANCSDGIKNQDETDVDCGGHCEPCDLGLRCLSDKDCKSNFCFEGICKAKSCIDTCNNSQELFCSSVDGDVWKCQLGEDGCYHSILYKDCKADEFCDLASASCKPKTLSYELAIEDAPKGVKVYKQPGDFISITFTSPSLINLSYEFPFPAVEGPCSNKTIKFEGKTKCKFLIPENTSQGRYLFSTPEAQLELEVIKNPKTIFLTHREALFQRYGYDPKVGLILNQLYLNAQQQYGIVYYLDDYLAVERPWSSYSDYKEDKIEPSLDANLYALAAALLAVEKCKNCEHLIIIGDDFVVPHYRIEYLHLSGWDLFGYWISKSFMHRYIYTDQPYIPKTSLVLADIERIFEKIKKVKIVLPREVPLELREEINSLKETLTELYDSEIIEITQTACNDFSLGDSTLILIGNRSNNDAIKCIPISSLESKQRDTFNASIFLERNLWGHSKYAVIISGKNPEKGVKVLSEILYDPEFYRSSLLDRTNKVYIHEISKPPDIPEGSLIIGIVTGDCELAGSSIDNQVACTGTDFIASVAPVTSIITDARDTAIYCPTHILNKATGKPEPVFNGLVCYSSFGGLITPIIGIVSAPETGGSGYVASKIPDSVIAGLKRISKTLNILFKSNSLKIKKILDKAKFFDAEGFLKFSRILREDQTLTDLDLTKVDKILREIDNTFTRLTKVFSENKRNWNKLINYFGEDLGTRLKTIDDYEDIAEGTKAVVATKKAPLEQILEDLTPGLSKVERIEILKGFGRIGKKYGDDVAEQLAKNSDEIEEVTETTEGLMVKLEREGIMVEARYVDDGTDYIRKLGLDPSDASNANKADIGEAIMDDIQKADNLVETSPKFPIDSSDTGFDGVYKDADDNFVIIESKLTSTKGGKDIDDTILAQTATKGQQMSDEWIGKTIQEMKFSSDPVLQDLGEQLEIAKQNNKIRKRLVVIKSSAPDGNTITNLEKFNFEKVQIVQLGNVIG